MNNTLGRVSASLWRHAASLRLTLILLIALATVSTIGSTFVPQNAAPADYERLYSAPVLRVLMALQVTDMYRSWWYLLLLGLLMVNLLACTLRRLPQDVRLFMGPPVDLDVSLQKSLSLVQSWPLSSPVEGVAQRAAAALAGTFARPVLNRDGDTFYLFAQKGLSSRLGLYLVHSSLIFIFAGGLVGFYYGYKGFLSIEEGQSAATAVTRSEEVVDLGFTVRCDDFSVSYHANGKPKEYRSVLSILDHGTTVIAGRPVVVNAPLSYRGVSLYQSSYGEASFSFAVRDRKTGAEQTIIVPRGEQVVLANGDRLAVMESLGDVRGHAEDLSGPAVHVVVISEKVQPEAFFLLRDHPHINGDRGGAYRFRYEGVARWTTGLQANYDPGAPLVWVGCVVLMVGLLLVFSGAHRRIWLRVDASGLVVAGCAGRNSVQFRKTFAAVATELERVIHA